LEVEVARGKWAFNTSQFYLINCRLIWWPKRCRHMLVRRIKVRLEQVVRDIPE
jgi:hypothetical protein